LLQQISLNIIKMNNTKVKPETRYIGQLTPFRLTPGPFKPLHTLSPVSLNHSLQNLIQRDIVIMTTITEIFDV